MRIQFFSDLHLEFGPLPVPQVEADVCVAAGDIHVRDAGVEWLSQLKVPVVYIAGNHEFYTGETEAVRRRLAERCAAAGIYFLDDDEIVINGVRFLGTTLWTDFGGGDPALMDQAQACMNDYLHIHQGRGLLTPEQTLARHRDARAWLDRALALPFYGDTVVVSHHAPSRQSWTDSYEPEFQSAYCNDFEAMLAENEIRLWIHGHIHSCNDYHLNGVRVVSNPRGYHGYQTVQGFDPKRVVTL